MPDISDKVNGENYVKFYENTLYWVQCGDGEVEYRTADVLIVSFGLPAMNNEEFYGEQIVNNLAQFLSVPVEKVGSISFKLQISQTFDARPCEVEQPSFHVCFSVAFSV